MELSLTTFILEINQFPGSCLDLEAAIFRPGQTSDRGTQSHR